MTKICSKCKEEKGLGEFYKNKSCKDGLQLHCKKCESFRKTAYSNKNIEYWKNHDPYKEKLVKKCSSCKKNLHSTYFYTNLSKKCGLGFACKECIKKYQYSHVKVMTEQDKEVRRKQCRQYYFEHREEINLMRKKYDLDHKEERRMYWKQQNRRKNPHLLTEIGIVYILQERGTGYYKIGKSKESEFKNRICHLQCGNPRKLILSFSGKIQDPSGVEHDLHYKYSQYNGHGEWFKLTPETVEEIITYLKTQETFTTSISDSPQPLKNGYFTPIPPLIPPLAFLTPLQV